MGKTSPLYSINWNDIIKGIVMAVIGGIVSVISNDLTNGIFVFSLISLWHGAMVGGIAYITKNFFTAEQPVQIVTKTDDGTITKTAITTDQVTVVVPAA